ncbi:MAG: PAS domain-containing protein [bacterium]|nr:PAS domain-containing protein [bacterium]
MSNTDDAHPDSNSSDPPVVDFAAICHQMDVAVIACDTDLIVRFWNASAAHMFGAPAPRTLGASILTLVPDPRRNMVGRLLGRVVDTGQVERFDFTQRDLAGHHRHLVATVTPIRGDDGSCAGTVTSMTDITRYSDLLQERGRGRKMTALGEMAGAVAHHFNNILGGLVTGVDFALGSGDPGAEHRALEQTARSLNRAAHLVEHLLAFAEGDLRRRDLGDLTEVVYHAMEALEPELAGAEVALKLNIQTLPVTAVPRQQLLTVVFNLVHNAIDAMPDGGTLTIGTEPAGEWCVLRVSDTGCGMDEEHLDRIFEPFYSTKQPSRDGEPQATGFGLAFVHGVIQEIGGAVSVTSKVGHGTTFEVRIPVKPPDLPA